MKIASINNTKASVAKTNNKKQDVSFKSSAMMGTLGFTGALMGIISGGTGAGLIKSTEIYNKVQNGQQVSQSQIKDAIKENIDNLGEEQVKANMQNGANRVYSQLHNINNLAEEQIKQTNFYNNANKYDVNDIEKAKEVFSKKEYSKDDLAEAYYDSLENSDYFNIENENGIEGYVTIEEEGDILVANKYRYNKDITSDDSVEKIKSVEIKPNEKGLYSQSSIQDAIDEVSQTDREAPIDGQVDIEGNQYQEDLEPVGVENTEQEKKEVNKLTKDGITMTYVRNPDTNTQNYGTTYGQNLEPAGEYMSMDTLQGKNKIQGFEYGTIEFKNPLIVEHKDTTANGWKKDLSEKYNGLTGKEIRLHKESC